MKSHDIHCSLRLAHTDLVMKNHRVHGVSVMPGVVFLDLVMRILTAKGHKPERFVLERILYSEPVVTDVNADRELSVRVKLPTSDTGKVTVFSRVWGSKGEFKENMRASLSEQEYSAKPDLDIAQKKENSLSKVEMSEFYRRACLENINHNAPMRCTGTLWKGRGELLAELSLEVPGASGFYMHPAALDATTIAAYGQTEAAFSNPFIPVSLDKFRVVAPLPERFILHAPNTEVLASTGDVISNDYDLYDMNGKYCASFHKLTCKRIRHADLIKRLLADNEPAAASIDASSVSADSYGELLRAWIAAILNLDIDGVPTDVGFYELGLESRHMLDVARRLEEEVGNEVYPTLLFEFHSIDELDAHLKSKYGPYIGKSIVIEDAVGEAPTSKLSEPLQTVFVSPIWRTDTRQERPIEQNLRLFLCDIDAVIGEGLRQLLPDMGIVNTSLDRVIEEMQRGDQMPTAIVIGINLSVDQEQNFLALVLALTRFLHQNHSSIDVLFVERASEPSPLLEGLAALARCIRLETPRLSTRAVLVPPEQDCATSIVHEIKRSGSDFPATAGVVCARASGEFSIGLLAKGSTIKSKVEPKGILPRDALCIVAGGFGGIGVLLVEWLVRHFNARVLVLGRKALDTGSHSTLLSSDRIEFRPCDITDATRVMEAVDAIRREYGSIQAVFHLAGGLADGLHFNVKTSDLATVFAPKVIGFRSLDAATIQDDLKLFVSFSSLATWKPNPGQGVYALANAMMDTLVANRQQRGGRSLTINWPLWQDGGMQLSASELAASMQLSGLSPLPTQVAFTALTSALTDDQSHGILGPKVGVLHGDEQRFDSWLVDGRDQKASEAQTTRSQVEEQPNAVEPTVSSLDVAIIGLAGRFPGAEDIETFWQNLRNGVDSIQEVPEDRWDHDAIYDSARGKEGKTYGRWGGFLKEIDAFDAKFFHVSRRDAERADPQERLFLETCWTLLESAGYSAPTLTDRNIGVFAGVMWNHYQLCGQDTDVAPNAMHAAIANRVSYTFNLTGPSIAVDTACSSSLTAIHLAAESVRTGSSAMAIAGGVNLMVHPEKYLQLAQGQFMSDDGRCRSFGEGGTGYVPGEGVGAVLLKPLRDAIADGDHVWGVIRGSALNHAGRTSGFTVPSPSGQADVINRAIKHADVAPSSISYVEAHGTGTSLGDPIEIEGLARALGRTAGDRLPIGSIKSNIGHLESAAGIAAVAKVLLMLRGGELVPSLHSQTLNPALDLDRCGLSVPQTLQPWTPREKSLCRRAAISAFGAGGANAHIVIDEPPLSSAVVEAQREPQWLLLSARDRKGLCDYAESLANFLRKCEETVDLRSIVADVLSVDASALSPDDSLDSLELDPVDMQAVQRRLPEGMILQPSQTLCSNHGVANQKYRLADIAFTLQSCRTHLQERVALNASSMAEAIILLECIARNQVHEGLLFAQSNAKTEPSVAPISSLEQRWVDGLDTDFSTVWAGTKNRRIPLPVPPLLRDDRFWIGRWRQESSLANRSLKKNSIASDILPEVESELISSLNTIEPQDFSSSDNRLGAQIVETRMDHYSSVTLSVLAKGVALVKMQEIKHHNMFTQDLLDGLLAAFEQIASREDIRAVVLTGTEKVFSMGGTPDALERLARHEGVFTDVPFLYEGLANCRVPVIAAIRGHAAGGGLTFGLHADLVVLDRTGTYSANFVKFGFTPGLGATYALERRFGSALAHEMYLTGGNYLGQELEDLGAPLRFVDGVDVLPTALKMAEAIAENPPQVIGSLKRELASRTQEKLAVVIPREVAMHKQVLDTSLVPNIRAQSAKAQPKTVSIPSSDTVSAPPQSAGRNDAQMDAKIRDVIAGTLCGNLFLRHEELDDQRVFSEMGLDSLGAVELVRDLNKAFNLNLDSVLVYDYPTITRLAKKVQEALGVSQDMMADIYGTADVEQKQAPQSVIESIPLPISGNNVVHTVKVPEVNSQVDLTPVSVRESEYRVARNTSRASELSLDLPESPPPIKLAGAADASDVVFQTQEKLTLSTPASIYPQDRPVEDSLGVSYDADDIAIVGLSARYPGASDVDTFWQNLCEGTFSVSDIPAHRWDAKRFYDEDISKPGKTNSKIAGMIDDVDRFDAAFFGISPREAELMDPQQRVFLEQAWRALEHAGYAIGPDRRIDCGVFVGTASGDYLQLLREAGASDAGQVFLGSSGSVLAGRIAYFLNLKGPTVAVDTACSSSLVALHIACQAIRAGDCKMALAGGIALMTTPQMHIWNGKSGMLSARGRCASFDASADGFVLGEGVGAVVVKPLSAAIADRDEIYAVIKASGINGDGKTNGITAPSADAQFALQERVHSKAGVCADDIAYIETHGAGTQLGDPLEAKALMALMRNRSTEIAPCGIGSIKSNVGHTTLAAGVGGLIKVALGLKHGEIPPSLHFDQINPNIELDPKRLEVVTKRRQWPLGPSGRRMGAVNSFGVSGTNSHFVLAEAPVRPKREHVIVDEAHLLVLSAKSDHTLGQLITGLRADLARGVSIVDAAFTLGVGRAHYRKRLAIVARDALHADSLLARAASLKNYGAVVSDFKEDTSSELDINRALNGASLTQIANRFITEPNLDLGDFFAPRAGQRVPLCGYPFRDSRFWVPGANTLEKDVVGNADAPHASLRRVETLSIDSDLDWLLDHRVRGQHWVPGAATIFHAARNLSFDPVELSGIEWLSAASVSGPVQMEIENCVGEDGRYRLEIQVARALTSRAIYSPIEKDELTPQLMFEELTSGTVQHIDKSAFYAAFSSAGIEYGPSYQRIEEVRYDGNRAIASMTPGPSPIQTIDAVFQVVGVLAVSNKLQVPQSVRRVVINGAIDSIVRVLAERKTEDSYDLSACDANGRVVMAISGFKLVTLENNFTRSYIPSWRERANKITKVSPQRTYMRLEPHINAIAPKDVFNAEHLVDVRYLSGREPEILLEIFRKFLTALDIACESSRVIVITSGAVDVNGHEQVDPVQAALCSMARSAGAECPAWNLKVVDFAYGDKREPLALVRIDAHMPRVSALRDQRWYEPIVAVNDAPKPSVSPFLTQGCHVLVGGAGGIGFAFSKRLAQRYSARIGWIGRRPIDDDIRQKIHKIEKLGGRVCYVQGDLCDQQSIANAVLKVRQALGPISSVVHSALVLNDTPLAHMNPTQLSSVLRPKVTGIENLYRAVEAEPISNFILFSSVASILDSPGQANYAAASAYLDAYGAELYRRYQAPVYVVNWGYWGSVGVVSNERYGVEMARRGVGSIEPADGFDQLYRQISQGLRKVMVLNADHHRFHEYGFNLVSSITDSRSSGDVAKPMDKLMIQNKNEMVSSAAGSKSLSFVTVQNYLCNVFAQILKTDGRDLSTDESFETFGVDSLLGMDIVRELKRDLGNLPSTLLYEKLTIDELASHLLTEKNRELSTLLVAGVEVSPNAYPDEEASPASYTLSTADNSNNGADVDQLIRYLQSIFARVLKLPIDTLDVDETFESFGVDSLLSMDVLRLLKTDFPDLPSTLLYEYLTLTELANYLLTTHGQQIKKAIPLGPMVSKQEKKISIAPLKHEVRLSGTIPLPKNTVHTPTLPEARSTDDEVLADAIAVVGVVGRYPGAGDLEAFWTNLQEAKRSITEAPSSRGDWNAYFDEKPAKNRCYNRFGGFIDGIDQFDPKFFGILPSDASAMDPQERLFLETCWELVEQSGHNGTNTREQETGVFVGVMYGSYGQLAAAEGWSKGQFDLGHSPHWSVANRISYYFDFTGPSLSVDTACSSSMTAFHLACESIKSGECRQAIAGGVNLILHPAHHIALSSMNMLGTGPACRTFDEAADGIVPGEGVGAVLLRPLADALADGDDILAVVRGSGINSGGKTSGYTVPNPNAQSAAIQRALAKSGVSPDQVGCVEVHGTGTKLGDPIEIAALNRVFSNGRRSTPLYVSSVKANIGHLEGAAGIVGITKAILELQHCKIAPCAGLDELNERIDFSASVVPARTLQEWPSASGAEANIIGVSSFGAGGANAHVLLQHWHDQRQAVVGGESPQLFVLSANNHQQLVQYALRIANWLHDHTDVDFTKLCFTSQVGRRGLPVRCSVMADSILHLEKQLRQFAVNADVPSLAVSPPSAQKIPSLSSLGSEVVELLLAKGKLFELGEAWTLGLKVDWEKLWVTRPGMCVFPSVPFEHRRCWMDQTSTVTNTGVTSKRADALAQLASHHQIDGKLLVPGAALLWVMLDYCDSALPRSLTQVRWLKPVELMTGSIELNASVGGGAGKEVRLHSGGATVASAICVTDTISVTTTVPLNDFENNKGQSIAHKQLYGDFAAAGFLYGEDLRVLRDITKFERHVTARVSMDKVRHDLRASVIIDAGMQLVALLAQGRTAIPTKIGTVKQYLDFVNTKFLKAETTEDPSKYLITLWSGSGQLVAELIDLYIVDLPSTKNLGSDLSSDASRVEYLQVVLTDEAIAGQSRQPGCVLISGQNTKLKKQIKNSFLNDGTKVYESADGDDFPANVDTVVYAAASAGSGFGSDIQEHLSSLRDIVKNVKSVDRQARVKLFVVVLDDNAAMRALAGATRTLSLEFPWLDSSHVVLESMDDFSIASLFTELHFDNHGRHEVHLGASGRYVPQLLPFIPNTKTPPLMRPGGVYLVTGGSGALGRLFAEELLNFGPVTVVLLGRSPLSDEVQQWMSGLSQQGGCVLYRQTDVTDTVNLQRQVAEISGEYGAIRGVIHAAGIRKDALIGKKTDADFISVLQPKVDGVIALDAATSDQPLDFFLLCSSLASRTGNMGQVDYCVANRFLAEFGRERESQRQIGRRQGKTVTVEWPLWKSGGMEVDAATMVLFRERYGMEPMDSQVGIDALKVALSGLYECFAIVQRTAVAQSDHGVIASVITETTSLQHVERTTVSNALRDIAASFLLVDALEVDTDIELLEMGFDSISLTDMVNRINRRYNLDLLPTVLFECATLDAVVDYLMNNYSEALNSPSNVDAPIIEPSTTEVTITDRPIDKDFGQAEGGSKQRSVNAEDIAVVGAAGRIGGARSLTEFWEVLKSGGSLIVAPGTDRAELHANAKTTSIKAGFMDNVAEFDAEYFGISPREAALMDPQQRLLMETVTEAIQDAGYAPKAWGGRDVGIFVGVSTTDYNELIAHAKVKIEPHLATGIAHSIVANRVSHYFDWHGPSEVVDTACSSSLVAVNRAIKALRSGECETAIVGGVNVTLAPGLFMAFMESGMLSPDYKCKTFDASADGYVRGEGVGAVVLKPLSQALADKDSIYAVIKGTAVNHCGKSTSLTAPSPSAQAEVICRAFRDAKLDPRKISFIETHGTGTRLGDPVEVEGLKQAFEQLAKEQKIQLSDTPWVELGAVKTVTGHLEAASGISGLLRTLLSFKHGRLTANLNFSTLNPYIRLTGTPFNILSVNKPWVKPIGETVYAGVSSFGFGGTNAHIILASAPEVETRQLNSDALLVFPISAASDQQLRKYCAEMALHLTTAEVNLADVAFTLQQGRSNMAVRTVIVGRSLQSIVTAFQMIGESGPDADGLTLTQDIQEDPIIAGLIADWLNGNDVAWPALDAKRCSLPTPPFMRKYHWFTAIGNNVAMSPSRQPSMPESAIAKKTSATKRSVAAAELAPIERSSDYPRVRLEPIAANETATIPMIRKPDYSPITSPTDAQLDRAATSNVRDQILTNLSAILLTPVESIDVGRKFEEMGLDSILRMDLVRRVNEYFGLEITAENLYVADSVIDLEALIEESLIAVRGLEVAQGKPTPTRELNKSSVSVGRDSAGVAAIVRKNSEQITELTATVLDSVLSNLSSILLQPIDHIDANRSFDDMGLDSIFRVELVRRLNDQLSIELTGEHLYAVDSVTKLVELIVTYFDDKDVSTVNIFDAENGVSVANGEPLVVATDMAVEGQNFCDFLQGITDKCIDSDGDFSDSGLTSFDMLRVISSLESILGPLPKTSLFDYPTPRKLCTWIETRFGREKFMLLLKPVVAETESARKIETEYLEDGAAILVKRDIAAYGDLAKTVNELESRFGKEGGLPGRDIAPYIFLGSNASGYINFTERDSILLAWSSAVEARVYPALVAEWVSWAQSRGFRPNLLSMMELSELAGVPFCSTSFGTVQRLHDIGSFTLEGKPMSRLRKKVGRFTRAGKTQVDEYRIGSDRSIDKKIVDLIDEWAIRKDMVNPYVDTVRNEIGQGIMANRHRVYLTYLKDLLVAAVVITKIPSENGYLLDLEFFGDKMADGGLDYTVVEIIRRLAAEGVELFSFGATLGVKVNDSPNPHPEVERCLRELGETGIFRGDGNYQFKNKYRPENMPIYLCQPQSVSAVDVSKLLLLIINPTIDSGNKVVSELSVPQLLTEANVSFKPSEAGIAETDTPESERREKLRGVEWNPLVLKRCVGAHELVSDSWAERCDPSIDIRMRDLTETTNAVHMELSEQTTLPFDYIQAAASGRAAEQILLRAMGSKKIILQNNLFQSWTFNQLDLGFLPKIIDPLPSSSDIDLDHLDKLVSKFGPDIGCCCIELLPNATGGLAISLANLKGVSQRLRKAGISLVFDATRGLENLCLLSEAEGDDFWAEVSGLLSLADSITLSMSKDFGVNFGGIVATNDPLLKQAMRQRVLDRGEEVGLAGRQLLAAALADRDWVEVAVKQRISQVKQLARVFQQRSIPVKVVGGHAILLDAEALCADFAEPVMAVLAWLYEKVGVRAAPHMACGLKDLKTCVRLAIPVGLNDGEFRDLINQIESSFSIGDRPEELLLVGKSAGAPVSYVPRSNLPADVAEDLEAGLIQLPAARNWEILSEYLPSVKRHLVNHGGGCVEVFDSGENGGEAVVFLHPFNVGAGFFGPQVRDLSKTHRVIVIHAPGVGETNAAEDLSFAGLSKLVLAAVKGVGITRSFFIAGASFGGLTALSLAREYPDRVAGLILMGSSYKVGNRKGDVNRLAVVAREDFDALESAGVALAEGRGVLEDLLVTCESMDPKIGLRYLDVFISRPSLLEAASELSIPTMIIHGVHDTVIHLDIAKLVRDTIPSSQYFELDDAGHFPSFTAAPKVNQLIKRFVSECRKMNRSRTRLAAVEPEPIN